MTTEEHNKAVGICHLVYGGFVSLLMFAVLAFMAVIFSAIPTRPGGPDDGVPVALMGMFFVFMFIYALVFTVPSLIAGYAVLKRKSWARVASIIAAVFETMSFPFGTAVAVYSFWFMFSEAGRAMYDRNSVHPQRPYALRDTPPQPASNWDAQTGFGREREREYVPPSQPPDWRNE